MRLHLGNDDRLECPICGFDYVHLGRAKIDRLEDIIVVRDRKVSVEKRSEPSGRRGSVIGFRACCEAGHVFDVDFCFHKGQTFIEVTHRPDQEDERGGISLETLPRD